MNKLVETGSDLNKKHEIVPLHNEVVEVAVLGHLQSQTAFQTAVRLVSPINCNFNMLKKKLPLAQSGL